MASNDNESGSLGRSWHASPFDSLKRGLRDTINKSLERFKVPSVSSTRASSPTRLEL